MTAYHPAAHEAIIAPQINVLTCVEKWAQEQQGVLIAYNLFCDLVHPNIGSAFLVASVAPEGQLYFRPDRGTPVGKSIFEQSFPLLLSVTHKPFSELLGVLMATMWQDDELQIWDTRPPIAWTPGPGTTRAGARRTP